MTDELLEKLIAINNEKLSKVKPQNIKDGVTMFGVTGTLSAGNSVRLYSSIEERDEDIPVEGLIGLVYDSPFVDATLGASTYGLYFKKRVVLTTPVTLTDFAFMETGTTAVLSGTVTIDSTSAVFTVTRQGSSGTYTYVIEYTSEDGLTYIRGNDSRATIGQSASLASTIANQNTFPEVINFLGINTDSTKAVAVPITFGVYRYENGGWSYLDINGTSPKASEIVAQTNAYYYTGGNKAYTNYGFITGTYVPPSE